MITPPRQIFDISIIHKTYDFYLRLYALTKTFPKKDRHALGQKCENLALEILELLILANSQKQNRILTLNKIDVKLKILRIMVRLCFDTKIINEKKYLEFQKSLLEIGKMLGGWIKSSG